MRVLSSPSGVEPTGSVDLLRVVSRDVDILWLSALKDGTEEAVALGEASQAIHRALVALDQP